MTHPVALEDRALLWPLTVHDSQEHHPHLLALQDLSNLGEKMQQVEICLDCTNHVDYNHFRFMTKYLGVLSVHRSRLVPGAQVNLELLGSQCLL